MSKQGIFSAFLFIFSSENKHRSPSNLGAY